MRRTSLSSVRGAMARSRRWSSARSRLRSSTRRRAPCSSPGEQPLGVSYLRRTAPRRGARDHRVFAGRIEKRQLSFAEKAIMAVVRAPEGDFRSWEDTKEWAAGIARTLQPAASLIPSAGAAPPMVVGRLSARRLQRPPWSGARCRARALVARRPLSTAVGCRRC